MAGKLVWQGNWFGGETGLAGKLAWQRNWFGRETGLAGKLVETGFAGKLVSQGNLFFVTLGKTFINILVVKQMTYI